MQMLQNHSKPVGAQNRGERSGMVYDRRPLEDQIIDKIVDREPYTKDGSEFKEFNKFM